MNSSLPEKYFYTIGDVTRITEVKPHVLRYWESQFRLLQPARRYSGHRKYTQREIDLIRRIKVLILDRKFTLAGAKREINRQMTGRIPQDFSLPKGESASLNVLREIKKDVEDCLSLLKPEGAERELVGIK